MGDMKIDFEQAIEAMEEARKEECPINGNWCNELCRWNIEGECTVTIIKDTLLNIAREICSVGSTLMYDNPNRETRVFTIAELERELAKLIDRPVQIIP